MADTVYLARGAQRVYPITATGVGCLVAITGTLGQQSRAFKALSTCLAVLCTVSVPVETAVYFAVARIGPGNASSGAKQK